ncbi:S-adenosyl-L-methionine-dependent tRNA 4-demethylwyosine synthase TYW1-like isoform X2 [Glandiceps talaboti]
MDTTTVMGFGISQLWCNELMYYSLTALLALIISLIIYTRNKNTDKNESVDEDKIDKKMPTSTSGETKCLKIFFASQTGTSQRFADIMSKEASKHGVTSELINLKSYDPEDNLVNEADGQKVSKNLDTWLTGLSALRVMDRGEGNENVSDSQHGGIEEDFLAWKDEFFKKVLPLLQGQAVCYKGSDKDCQQQKDSNDEELYETSSDDDASDDDYALGEGGEKLSLTNGVVDLEDLGKLIGSRNQRKGDGDSERNGVAVNTVRIKKSSRKKSNQGEPKEMITPLLRQSLTKQGYKLIGSHSGVKLCRWTKSMLRGRGGCYKHTFYGIESHRCMETTPSLACANKCVFCWRHHTNPVGTEWKWKMDGAQTILDGAIQNHRQLIKQFRGVPGVQPERFQEAMQIKHCALSLVGEPIMYPEINKYIQLLHSHSISTFLVTNAQFPEAIRNLVPVTQLYVSVDASTKDSLKKIDRPLFRDFWPRFLDSLKELSLKGQRTVYRLTLVKSWNTDEIQSYADLIAIGQPDFIEVKGVTYCGESKASSLTMKNIPWHREVVSFVQQLADQLPDYDIACEHEHSNCVLIAHNKFKVDGTWHTWIDYSRFHQLIQSYENDKNTFTAEDYMAKTPAWAVFGSNEQGFDPVETRFHRKKKKDISGC